jgi:hypothetical protein
MTSLVVTSYCVMTGRVSLASPAELDDVPDLARLAPAVIKEGRLDHQLVGLTCEDGPIFGTSSPCRHPSESS